MGKSLLKGAPRRKKKIIRRSSTKSTEPKWDDALELTGEQYSRRKGSALDCYRLDYKNADYKRWVLEWAKADETWKDKAKTLSKVPESRFHATVGGCCRLLNLGCPDVFEKYNVYWEGLAGTMGTPKPISEFVNKTLKELYIQAERMIEEKKIEEEKEKRKEAAKPSIQERIKQQVYIQMEKIDVWLDTWLEDYDKFSHKGFDVSKHLKDVSCTQAHARKMKEFYQPEIDEFKLVSSIPSNATISKMPEDEKDEWEQIKEAYSPFSKKQIDTKLKAYEHVMGALDVIILTAKANRKPRKRIRSKEKMVAKLKYALNNDKFQIVSINPQDIIYASELWVFNVKTRKLGRYIAQNIDPMHQGREGSGLSVKGTTITGFNEEKSIQKTLRKPEEKIKEFSACGPRKVITFLDDINALNIKLNGRINPDTILLKAIL